MLCKWQVQKLCIFYILSSIRGGKEVAADGSDRAFKLLLDSVIFSNWSYHFLSLLSVYQHLSSCLPPQPSFLLISSSCLAYFYTSLFIYTSIHSVTHICPPCPAWTWPQLVNILPLEPPLCRYNDHLTLKSKARRKLGRRRQRGQQHWTNYVPFSPSILTLMKSLIIRGRGGGGGGQVHKMYIRDLS